MSVGQRWLAGGAVVLGTLLLAGCAQDPRCGTLCVDEPELTLEDSLNEAYVPIRLVRGMISFALRRSAGDKGLSDTIGWVMTTVREELTR